MNAASRAAIRVCGAVVLASLSACAIENVFHSARAVGYPGYAVEYVHAVPNPGTYLSEGDRVEFKVTVRYVLQARDAGIVELLFRNELGADILPPGVMIPIKRDRWQTATLVQEIRIPSGWSHLLVTVPVIPDGATTSFGMLVLRYPVVPPPK